MRLKYYPLSEECLADLSNIYIESADQFGLREVIGGGNDFGRWFKVEIATYQKELKFKASAFGQARKSHPHENKRDNKFKVADVWGVCRSNGYVETCHYFVKFDHFGNGQDFHDQTHQTTFGPDYQSQQRKGTNLTYIRSYEERTAIFYVFQDESKNQWIVRTFNPKFGFSY